MVLLCFLKCLGGISSSNPGCVVMNVLSGLNPGYWSKRRSAVPTAKSRRVLMTKEERLQLCCMIRILVGE